MDHHHYHGHDQYSHQVTTTNNNPYNIIITTPPPITMDSTASGTMTMDDKKKMMTTRPQEPRNCPRCNSSNTKFCYYNNYSLAQPRYLCKSCRRYWTEGGSLRNIPVGGGSRKNKKLPLVLPNTSSSSTSTNLLDLNPPLVFASSSSNPSKNHQNNIDLSLSFASTMQDMQAQERYGHFSDQVVAAGGQNSLFPTPTGMIQFRQEYAIGNHGSGSKTMFPCGDHDDHHHDHEHERNNDGSKNKREGGSINELWSGIILGSTSGGPTW